MHPPQLCDDFRTPFCACDLIEKTTTTFRIVNTRSKIHDQRYQNNYLMLTQYRLKIPIFQ